MKLVYIAIGALAVIAVVLAGRLFVAGPQPEIVVPAEVITKVGPLNITNTLLTAWIVMAILVLGSLLATRSMKLMPSGVQNFVEASVGFLLGQVEEIAGEKNGRRFFMVVATFFLFIIASNWFGLFPFFNAIGKTEDVGHEIFHELASEDPEELVLKDGKYEESHKFAGWKMDEGGGVVLVKPGGKAIDFEVLEGHTPGETLDRYIVFLAEKFADFEPQHDIEEGLADPADVNAAFALLGTVDAKGTAVDAPRLIAGDGGHGAEAGGEGHGLESPGLHRTFTGVDFENSQKMALVVPFFRGVYSDVNNTLALAICSFLIVEFWGFRSLGIGYLGKFFVNPFKPPMLIGTIVGILELLSEFIRIISFTFRLFGNIFAGEVLVLMLTFLMPFVLVDVIYALELFVGFIQAAVFALLTLVFATMAVEHHGGEEHEEGSHGHDALAPPHPGAAQAH